MFMTGNKPPLFLHKKRLI